MTTLRTETERLLVRLNREVGVEFNEYSIHTLADKTLLNFINQRLIKLNCIPFSENELNKKLN